MTKNQELRIYRGITRSYSPDKVEEEQRANLGTNFTDCPYRAPILEKYIDKRLSEVSD